MGWWSAQRNDGNLPLVELANTTNSVKGNIHRGITVQARTASPSIWGTFTHFLNDYSSPLVELANTTNSLKGSTKRGITVYALTTSPSIWGTFTHFLISFVFVSFAW